MSDPLTSSSSLLITGGTGSFGKAFVKTVLERYPDINRLAISSLDEPTAPASRRCSGPVSRSRGLGARLGDERPRRRFRAWRAPHRETLDARKTVLIVPHHPSTVAVCEWILRLQERRVFDEGRLELMLGEQLTVGAAFGGTPPNDQFMFSVMPTPCYVVESGGIR